LSVFVSKHCGWGAALRRSFGLRRQPGALCVVFLCHILARRNATHCFMGGPKRHIQPERYATFDLIFFEKIIQKIVDMSIFGSYSV
jgi:hypothetical protein